MEMDENARGHRPRSRVGRVGALERLWHQLRTLWRRPLHLWRASLGFRVVVATMLLGILVLTAVGTYLYGSIAQGLVDGRQSIAAVDSQRDAKDTQTYFQYTDKVDSTANVGQAATDQIRSLQRDSGTEERYVVLSRLETNNNPNIIGPIESGAVGARFIPPELSRAVAENPRAARLLGMTFRSFRYFARKYNMVERGGEQAAEAAGGASGA